MYIEVDALAEKGLMKMILNTDLIEGAYGIEIGGKPYTHVIFQNKEVSVKMPYESVREILFRQNWKRANER